MDLKTLIAQTSAPHMQRIGNALDELRASIDAARAAGFGFSLRFPEKEAEPADAFSTAIRQQAVATVLDETAVPVLEYKATIEERASA